MHVNNGAPHDEPSGSAGRARPQTPGQKEGPRVAPTRPRVTPTQPPTSQGPTLPEGTIIAGRFTLEAPAGRGGMGTVYRATDALSGRPVALKLLHLAPSDDTARRFTREAELLSSLRHPGIVSYVSHGQTGQAQPFLAMEWLEGEDLAQRLARQPLSLAETLSLLRHTARALAVAHQQGVIHRDLKPSNLFLRQGRPEDVVLLDFGLARHVLPSTIMTASQMLVGTPGYMAPEQVYGHSQLTPAADIFSLGCVLYECLTGQAPFRAPHLMATLARILFNEPTPLRQLRPELPAALQQLLERMLAKESARRLPDAQSLLAALDELQALLEVETRVVAGPPAAPLPRLAGVREQLATVRLAAPRATARHAPQEPVPPPAPRAPRLPPRLPRYPGAAAVGRWRPRHPTRGSLRLGHRPRHRARHRPRHIQPTPARRRSAGRRRPAAVPGGSTTR